MASNTLHGRGGAVRVAAVPNAAPFLITTARSWRFVLDQELIENVQGFGGVWKSWLLFASSWTVQIEGNLDTAPPGIAPGGVLWNAAAQPEQFLYGPVTIALYPDGNNTARFYSGNGWPKLTVEARTTDVIRFTFDAVGDGPLSVH